MEWCTWNAVSLVGQPADLWVMRLIAPAHSVWMDASVQLELCSTDSNAWHPPSAAASVLRIVSPTRWDQRTLTNARNVSAQLEQSGVVQPLTAQVDAH